SRVDPATTLREQDFPSIRSGGLRVGVRNKLVRHVREMLNHQSSEVTIFTERQKILLVKSVHIAIGISFNNLVCNDERAPLIRSSETVHAETVPISAEL